MPAFLRNTGLFVSGLGLGLGSVELTLAGLVPLVIYWAEFTESNHVHK